MKDPKSEGGKDSASTVSDAMEEASSDSDAIEQAERTDGQDREPIPAQTIDIVAPFGDNQISVVMYDIDNRISRVARTAKGTTLRFVLNEHERLFVTVADPTLHDEFLASAEDDAAARG